MKHSIRRTGCTSSAHKLGTALAVLTAYNTGEDEGNPGKGPRLVWNCPDLLHCIRMANLYQVGHEPSGPVHRRCSQQTLRAGISGVV